MTTEQPDILALFATQDDTPSASPDGPKPTASRRRVRRRILMAIGIPIGLVSVLALSYSGSLVAMYQNNVMTVEIPDDLGVPGHTRPPSASNGAQTMLLVGSDSMDDPNTFLLMRISGARDAITTLSLPGTLTVTPPGSAPTSLAAVEPERGINGLIGAVEDFSGARVDHYIGVDLHTFADVADVLGGVTVQNPEAFTSSIEQHSFAAGPVRLTGATALEYVRETDALPGGEAQRMQNQQAFLAGAARGVLSAKTLTSPATIADLVARVTPSLEVDSELDAVTLIGLGWELRSLRPDDLGFASLPDDARSGAGQQSFRDAVKADRLPAWLKG
ncbi:LCP family protein [Microbacteriaceae bacterium VKM Ac-2854]|nr:LCP family protein [Microbacteriaceae bacterium VKM Ac-2854]